MQTSLWLVLHDDIPVRLFKSRVCAIDAVLRAVSLRLGSLGSTSGAYIRLQLLHGGLAYTDCGRWSIVSVPVEA